MLDVFLMSQSADETVTTLMLLTCLYCLRSPWSNRYFPDLDDGAVPSDKLRQLEIDANVAFDIYRDM